AVLDGRSVAAFFAESIPGCAGQVVPPSGYLEQAYGHARDAGALCVADEVQVGFGRVGSHWWAFEAQGAVPDLVTLGKPIGNGHPMGAVVTTREIADAFDNGMEYFNTFGGNPVSCAVGLAVLDVIEEEGLRARALEVGTRFREGLAELAARHELVGDVRGLGLFIGVELVRDRETLEPATEEAADVVNLMRDRRILLSTDGPFENVIKIKPPLVFTHEDAGRVVGELDAVLAGVPPRGDTRPMTNR
ncbi:MAG: aminotransferase class III-fold pyridoxal phosphate-dependent enzyme, partial [marine benthic group bacterium]|nr:aminotransferase class III-fold pyridoxal phosphate-dependent enzyme [Candidatus Benthicola marisminoris]